MTIMFDDLYQGEGSQHPNTQRKPDTTWLNKQYKEDTTFQEHYSCRRATCKAPRRNESAPKKTIAWFGYSEEAQSGM